MSFEILVGGQNPKEIKNIKMEINDEELPEVKKQIEGNNVILDHWNNCAKRSEKMEYVRPGCCNNINETVVGYQCFKLGILDLTPLICERCNSFEQKEENKE